MLLPAEIEARTSVPAIRALVARKLTNEHHLAQQQVANLLGITQAAVSNYLRGRRGGIFQDHDLVRIHGIVAEICNMLVSDDTPPKIIAKFNEACEVIRRNRLLCDIHKQMDPTLDVESCHVCDGDTGSSGWKPVSIKLG